MKKYAVFELHFLVQDERKFHRIPLGLKVSFSGITKKGADTQLNLKTRMERDEDGIVLGSTRLTGSQRLHQ
jgi:hypothetical protein